MSLRSKRNWGIGDFTDLRNLAVWAQSTRGAVVSLEPLQPIVGDVQMQQLVAAGTQMSLVYASASFINPAYLDVEVVADFVESEEIQRYVLAPQFQATLSDLRKNALLDFASVWSEKNSVLQLCYQYFREAHLTKKTDRARAFKKFQSQGGLNLQEFSLFEAIKERLSQQGSQSERAGSAGVPTALDSWETWPDTFRKPNSPGALEFLHSNLERIEYSQYLQWLADQQLMAVISFCLDKKFIAGLLINQPERILENGFQSWATGAGQSPLTLSGAVRHTTNVSFIESPSALLSVATDHHPMLLLSLLPFLRPDIEGGAAGDWRYKTAVEIESLPDHAGLQEAINVLSKARPTVSEDESAALSPAPPAVLPQSTYRFQFNKDFTYKMAEKLVAYLAKLGISHCYASPLLKARPGSMHGYDIISHKELNPEIGTAAEFDALVKSLRKHGLGLIMDIVPNHMGIGKVNPWWMDVLENGPASIFADYFDIDWAPIKPELYGKVTIPVLGEAYGAIVKGGHFKIAFDADRGALKLIYYDHEFPLNPLSYPQVLNNRIDVLKERLGTNNKDVMEYQSIITALSQLPAHTQRGAFGDRIREKQVQMSRLSSLCKRNAEMTHFIEQNLSEFDVRPGDRACAERMHTLLEAQAYRLVFWRVATDEINYRRFFDVNDLAAVRTEDPRVFAEMHDLIFTLLGEGKIDGLRIDHPDGLFDPAAYFSQLQIKAAEKLERDAPVGSELSLGKSSLPIYIVVEKILAPFEHLEDDWAVHGTVGYDFLNCLQNVFIASEKEELFDDIYEKYVGKTIEFERLKRECKGLILDTVLASELHVLAHRLNEIAQMSWNYRDFTLNSLRTALRNVVINFPVYRTYVTPKKTDKNAKQYIDWAIRLAKRYGASVMPEVYDFVRNVLCLEVSDGDDQTSETSKQFQQALQTFALKFQQFTGPVMAKSVEDTLFYRFNRFVCLNEVGGEPDRFGISVASFHYQNQQRQLRRPYELLATSTHDTKRSEDVRARLAVLSELPTVWEQKISHWTRINRARKVTIDEEQAPDANDEYLIYQTLVGACPHAMAGSDWVDNFKGRISEYVLKAARESKSHTSWVNKNEEYEHALTNFVEKILNSSAANLFFEDFTEFAGCVAPLGLLNGLAQTVLKFTAPGVPDIYQGNEIWDFSLVDPDNRRPVDYKIRGRYLDDIRRFVELTGAHRPSDKERTSLQKFLSECLRSLPDGRAKLLTIAVALACRKSWEGIFTAGKYHALEIKGKGEAHVIAFAREHNNEWVVTVVPRLVGTLLALDNQDRLRQSNPIDEIIDSATWGDTAIVLPQQIAGCKAVNLFDQEIVEPIQGSLQLSNVLAHFPVAILKVQL